MPNVKNLKAFMIGVMLRYNDQEELKQVSANHIISDPSELVKILRGI